MLLKKIVETIKKHYLFLIFLSLIIALIFATYKNYGVTWDEIYYFLMGRHYTIKILDFLNIPNNFTPDGFEPTQVHLAAHGVFFDVLVISLTPFFRVFNLENYHLIKAFLSLCTFVFLYFLLLKLVTKKWALFGTFLLLLFPHFYGNIFNNSIDIQSIIIFTLFLCLFLDFLNNQKSFPRLILLSLSLSILINQRIIFLYVFMLSAAFLIKKPKLLFLLTLLTFIFIHLTNPYLWQHPVFGFIDMLKTSSSYPFTASNLFEGQYIPASEIPWYYIPKLIAITTPLATLGLFIVGNFYLFFSFFNKTITINLKMIYVYILALFYLPLIVIFVMKPALYDSWRHFYFLTLPLIVIAVFGVVAISKIKNKLIKIIFFGLIAINLFQTAYEMKVLHPYQYIYYNQLVGGLKGAYRKYETDYWGAAFKEATLWFNKNINDPKVTYYIRAEGDSFSSNYYFKDNMILTNDFNLVKYVFSFTRWNADEKYTGKIIHIIEREGVPLVFIKEN